MWWVEECVPGSGVIIIYLLLQEVIRDALLRGCLPLAQSYLIQRGPQDVVSLIYDVIKL